MNEIIRSNLNNLWSEDRQVQNQAYTYVLYAADEPVDWAYEAWDEVVRNLAHQDNHNRAIAAQVLCALAKSDPDYRLAKDFNALLQVTRDERFVTARHCLQALWKVGVAGERQQKLLIEALTGRFKECITEKNCTLIRFDILQSMRNVYTAVKDEGIKARALELIEIEEDPKYRKKYSGLWRK